MRCLMKKLHFSNSAILSVLGSNIDDTDVIWYMSFHIWLSLLHK